jgi:hypothetical protein
VLQYCNENGLPMPSREAYGQYRFSPTIVAHIRMIRGTPMVRYQGNWEGTLIIFCACHYFAESVTFGWVVEIELPIFMQQKLLANARSGGSLTGPLNLSAGNTGTPDSLKGSSSSSSYSSSTTGMSLWGLHHRRL